MGESFRKTRKNLNRCVHIRVDVSKIRNQVHVDAARIKREFSKPPSVPLNVRRNTPAMLKEWGSSLDVDGEDIFSLDDLEEFQSTDLSFMQVSAAITHHKDLPEKSAELEEPPRKRRKLDTTTLYNVIPQVPTLFDCLIF